jgi:hypothetical protein
VKQNKTGGNLSKGQSKNTAKSWKDKAQERAKENTRLKKRNVELVSSRDLWKKKYQSSLLLTPKGLSLDSSKAKHHQYSLWFVLMLIEMQKYGGMSLRGCRHCVGTMLLILDLGCRIPSHNSIRNWLCKSGNYRVRIGQEQGGIYVIYVDESIVFGSEKVLLILGIRIENIPADRSVSHQDMEVLYVGFSTEWKSEHIEAELAKIAVNKQILYVVSDEGTNLRKAYLSCRYTHIEDCTHILANHLKRIYGEDETFEDFRKLIGKCRRDWNLSKEKSQYMPPCMRGKMWSGGVPFANIFPCVDWAEKCLNNWQTLSPTIQESLKFLKDNQAFIEELIQIEKAFKQTCEILKNDGFGIDQEKSILEKLNKLSFDKRSGFFIENIKQYLKNLSQKSQGLNQKHLLCSSDIIESFFGKFKQKINPNSRSGLTEFIFTIANFTKPFTQDEVKKALESVKVKDLKQLKNRAKPT